MSIDSIEEQIRNLYKLTAYTENERTLRLYCRMIVNRMECKKATVRAAAPRNSTALLSF